MKRILIGVMLFGTVAIAASGLETEFQRREGLRLDQDQGNAINFVRALGQQQAVEKILEIEVIDPIDGGFLTRDREGVTCLGNISGQMFRCKSPIGVVTLDVGSNPELIQATLANASSSALSAEVARREAIQFDASQENMLRFLGAMSFPANRVVEFNFIGDATDETFVLRDRDDLVCLGKVKERILRCKNSIGLTTVNFQGDSD